MGKASSTSGVGTPFLHSRLLIADDSGSCLSGYESHCFPDKY